MGAMQRRKGQRIERELVELHKAIGVYAERVPLSGSTRYQGNGSDLDVYPWGHEAPPLCCEVKARESGAGFVTLERWLADNDVLFLRRNNAEPLVMLPWRVWRRILQGGFVSA
jgi:Holliday junction resolvase